MHPLRLLPATALLVACGANVSPDRGVANSGSGERSDHSPDGRYFVVAPAALCPTPAAAAANTCGNSIEDPDAGYLLARGADLVIDGAENDEIWRATRYMLAGELPGFVAAARLARHPDLTHLDAFRAAHPAAMVHSARDLRLGSDGNGELDYTLVVDGVHFAFGKLVTDDDARPWDASHACVVDACPDLSYVCDETYCDEVWIEIANGALVAIGDRFGTFAAP